MVVERHRLLICTYIYFIFRKKTLLIFSCLPFSFPFEVHYTRFACCCWTLSIFRLNESASRDAWLSNNIYWCQASIYGAVFCRRGCCTSRISLLLHHLFSFILYIVVFIYECMVRMICQKDKMITAEIMVWMTSFPSTSVTEVIFKFLSSTFLWRELAIRSRSGQDLWVVTKS